MRGGGLLPGVKPAASFVPVKILALLLRGAPRGQPLTSAPALLPLPSPGSQGGACSTNHCQLESGPHVSRARARAAHEHVCACARGGVILSVHKCVCVSTNVYIYMYRCAGVGVSVCVNIPLCLSGAPRYPECGKSSSHTRSARLLLGAPGRFSPLTN